MRKLFLLKKLKNIDAGLVLTLFLWGGYFTFVWKNMLYYNNNGDLVAGWINVWGDFPAHFVYASPFAYRDINHWFIANPIFINSKFTYPFVADAISGLLMRFGLDITNAFIFPSIILSFLFLFIFYKFSFYLTKSKIASFLSVSIFLMGGGLGFVYFFTQDLQKFINSFVILRQYTHMEESFIKWINPITSELIPQRAFLLGLPLTLFILYKLNTFCVQKFKIQNYKIVLLGLFAGVLPIIHMHSFLALFIFCLFLFLYNIKHYKKLFLFAFSVAFPVLVIYFLFYFKQINTDHFIEYFPGWIANKKEFNQPILNFWFWNFGLFLPLSVVSFISLKLYKNYLYSSALFIFIICHLYKFQPWAWDNSKLLTYWYLIFSIANALFITKIIKRDPLFLNRIPNIKYPLLLLKSIVVLTLFFVLTFSGFLDLINLANYKKNSYTIISSTELQVAKDINMVIPSGSVVLASTNHNGLISNHTKAQVLMGYGGWLWSYGLNYGPVLDDIYKMYRDPAINKELFKKYGVKYVFISDAERYEYSPSEYLLDYEFAKVYQNNSYTLYKVRLN